jgi:hypothetical protein
MKDEDFKLTFVGGWWGQAEDSRELTSLPGE